MSVQVGPEYAVAPYKVTGVTIKRDSQLSQSSKKEIHPCGIHFDRFGIIAPRIAPDCPKTHSQEDVLSSILERVEQLISLKVCFDFCPESLGVTEWSCNAWS